jgi:hypothetical protein
LRTILLSFDEKWYPVLKSGDKIFEHRRKFCNEEVRAYLYLGKPRQQIVAEIGLAKRELLEDWLEQYRDNAEVVCRIQDFMMKNKFAMKVLWFKEIEPINMAELQENFPELKIPISFHFLDKKPAVLNWLDENKKYTGYQIENDFSDISQDDICVL